MAPAASLRAGLAAVAGLGHRVDVGPGRVHRRVHVGDLALHELELADRLAELLALVDVGQHHVHAGLHDAERPGGQHRALVIEPAHQHVHAAPDARRARSPPAPRNPGTPARRCCEPRMPSLSSFCAQWRSPAKPLLDQEGGDAARPGLRVGLGIDHQHVGIRPVGDPHLGAVQHVAVAALLRAQPHAHHVRPGAGLAHRQRADMLAADRASADSAASAPRCRCGGSG